MKLSPDSTRLTKRQLVIFTFMLLMLAGVIGIIIETTISIEMAYFLLPTLATITIFLIFLMVLKWQVSGNLFGELGFLYLAFAVAYTLFPAFTFIAIGSDLASWEKLAQLLPAPSELSIHLWRHVLFVFGVAAGYLLVRGHGKPQLITTRDQEGKDGPTIVFLIGMTTICILCLSLLSAPVETYIDNYTRFDHLSWFPRKFASLCIRLKLGLYAVLITFLFRNYKKYKLTIFIIVATIGAYEMIHSFGSRIETLMVLLIVVCLYHYFVKSITLKKGLVACLALAVLFSAVELFRHSGFDVNTTEDVISQQGLKPASEFGSVYFTSFHLYSERAQGTMDPTEWPMFFSDFISIVTFGDFTRWNPQYWYARNYFPDAVVPPETMGPIADSAIWGGEIDLLFRSLINGAFFAYITRWFLRRKDKWWAVAVYAYCFATCVATLKYSIFYHLTPLFKNLLPILLVVSVVRKLKLTRSKRAISGLPNLA